MLIVGTQSVLVLHMPTESREGGPDVNPWNGHAADIDVKIVQQRLLIERQVVQIHWMLNVFLVLGLTNLTGFVPDCWEPGDFSLFVVSDVCPVVDLDRVVCVVDQVPENRFQLVDICRFGPRIRILREEILIEIIAHIFEIPQGVLV
ncbi:hypothetical protein WICPIJ_008717 [Wickerhamomyces pijperi]|uniref:Uncharacterized protein n=1 Tax=Wickerhamomyces pijperi TaxID=599730 RepID=A0A9P8PXM2_WICPI|nr:hypothetical protein WICPIJ_008717 [Wickerhamomyces pijperi]